MSLAHIVFWVCVAIITSPLWLILGASLVFSIAESLEDYRRYRHLRLREKYLALAQGLNNLAEWDDVDNRKFHEYKGKYEYHKKWLEENK